MGQVNRNVCRKCGHKFTPFEHIVKHNSESSILFCERCFFDYALDRLNFVSRQIDYSGEELVNNGEESEC